MLQIKRFVGLVAGQGLLALLYFTYLRLEILKCFLQLDVYLFGRLDLKGGEIEDGYHSFVPSFFGMLPHFCPLTDINQFVTLMYCGRNQ